MALIMLTFVLIALPLAATKLGLSRGVLGQLRGYGSEDT